MSERGAVPREALGESLRVERRGAGVYEAVLEDHFGVAQAGDLLARCALAALAEDAETGHTLRSLHVDWLAPLPPGVPLSLRVAPLGPESGLCELRAARASTELCRGSARVEARRAGPTHQAGALPPALPSPESLPPTIEYARREGWPEAYASGPVEFRRVGPLRPDRARGESTEHVSWLALRAQLPRDPHLEQAALVFLACFYDHWEFERSLERLDYARFALRAQSVQIHRATRPEGWLLLRAASRVAEGGVALGSRELFARSGELLASGVAEALVAEI
jgi:acyl-CoA thioesterase